MKQIFNLKIFEDVPTLLKPADYVDILLFLINKKLTLRLAFNESKSYNEVISWCKKYKFHYIISKSGFMYISKKYLLAWITMKCDDSTYNHTLILGLLLGYPLCCSRKVASIGELEIDNYENELISNNSFEEPYNIINPKGYIYGYSFISHVPCCASCNKSLKIAEKAYKVVKQNKDNPKFSIWKEYWF